MVLPGGVINPDYLSTDETVIGVVRPFIESGQAVAAIRHAPWLLVQADAVRGRQVTSFRSACLDVVDAGGQWGDQPVVANEGIVTSSGPQGIPAFAAKIIEEVQEVPTRARQAPSLFNNHAVQGE